MSTSPPAPAVSAPATAESEPVVVIVPVTAVEVIASAAVFVSVLAPARAELRGARLPVRVARDSGLQLVLAFHAGRAPPGLPSFPARLSPALVAAVVEDRDHRTGPAGVARLHRRPAARHDRRIERDRLVRHRIGVTNEYLTAGTRRVRTSHRRERTRGRDRAGDRSRSNRIGRRLCVRPCPRARRATWRPPPRSCCP